MYVVHVCARCTCVSLALYRVFEGQEYKRSETAGVSSYVHAGGQIERMAYVVSYT